MAERYSSFTPGGTGWLLQRITAAFLVVVLAFHFFQLHFITHAADVTFAGTQARMEHVGYFLTMVLFLVTATFHGINGVYNALVNQGLDGIQKKVVLAVLTIAGLALIAQGTYVALVMAGWA
ncbi:succinate dehydrogenase hydrophobic membrane anchor subunit [Halobacteria archaeon AArc-m2/3/4]|uniref:Succinate dehydrogenase hydrophobic membrane anchor subunit n=1 Tax=Natronoglomus mannanivorans TaxID=2979990 RepID=A0AAP2YW64_9EURY|nr:succinate dehydrogenase hydrophobic membrane anchor subunit [Halobacteria archaeon AArc-xg1-1]MCU4971768.1 succinate dehydrogenase hydrophobic membrane anchor subunit [Halobacteria archaeon AArc-m2/3/4]